MTATFTALISKAIRALPAKSPVRAELSKALKTRADYAARGQKAWRSRRVTKKARKAVR